MPLIEFPPAGVTDVAQSAYLRRLIRGGRVVGSFLTVQVIVQLSGFLSGILLIRMLEQRGYAFFTIANTMQGTLNLLADVGISVGIVSIGGRVWQDRPRFSQLTSAALHLRRRLVLVAAIAITLLYFMLKKRDVSQLHRAANHSRSDRPRHPTRCRCAGGDSATSCRHRRYSTHRSHRRHRAINDHCAANLHFSQRWHRRRRIDDRDFSATSPAPPLWRSGN